MKKCHDIFGDPWECDGERFRIYLGADFSTWSRWHAGDYSDAERYMRDMGCAPEVIVWEEAE